MHRIALIVSLLLTSVSADTQRVCKRGIPFGNTCIAADRTCRVGPGKADAAAPSPMDSVAAKAATPPGRAPVDSTVATARATPAAPPTPTTDSGATTDALAKAGMTKVWTNTK